jgi:RecJ-like exonuclease
LPSWNTAGVGNETASGALSIAKEAPMAQKHSQNQKHTAGSRAQTSHPGRMLNPGDEARPGTPGTGEDICPECHGKGRIHGSSCPSCGGTGKIVEGIGGG